MVILPLLKEIINTDVASVLSRVVPTAPAPDFIQAPNLVILEYEILILTPAYPNDCIFTGSSEGRTGGSPQ